MRFVALLMILAQQATAQPPFRSGVRARDGYVAPRLVTSPEPPANRIDALIDAPIQARGLTMRVRAVPAPLAERPGSTVAVGIEVPAADAVRAGSIDSSVVAVDLDGKARARQRVTTRFQPQGATVTGWTRLGSRLASGEFRRTCRWSRNCRSAFRRKRRDR